MTIFGFVVVRQSSLTRLEEEAFEGRRLSRWLTDLRWWFPDGHPVQEAAKGIMAGERIDALRERILRP